MAVKTTITSSGSFGAKLRGMADAAERLSQQNHSAQVICSDCGGTSFRYDDAKGDEGHLWCEKCGLDLGTRREALQKAVTQAAAEKLRSALSG